MNKAKENVCGLLSDAQVFGENRIKVIDQLGASCAPTDFAVLRGAEKSGENAKWFLGSAGGFGDVCTVSADGLRILSYANASGGIRPVLPCADLSGLTDQVAKDISGFPAAKYGEYPQTAADRETARQLESEYSAGRLRTTGKRFCNRYEEYTYRENKYIRAEYEGATHVLSDGRTHQEGEPVWIRVETVRWLFDEKEDLLVSESILDAGICFCGSNYYDGDFGNTEVCRFLNEEFAEDLVPSEVRELTEEEQAAYDEAMAQAEHRRNPYGLTFGQVTEEDIIRGAIESDIAVFLHGPSSEGKSARVKQIDPTCEIIYLRNATPDSLNGRSVYNQSTGEMIDIPPTWYKKVKAKCEAEPDKFHVVFFDEINNALPSIQGMAFNIVLDREVNGLWKLPDNARVVAAGNDMQDSLAANQIAAPFFNRFAHVYINTTTDKWLKWAREHRIHPAIYSYIAYKKGEPLRSAYTGEKPNADPRKWEMASKMLYRTGRPEMLRALIGEDITDEFVQFCSQPVITLERVLQGDIPDSEIERLNTAERYATTMGLSMADESQLEAAEAFAGRLGEEFRAVFESMRYAR